MSRCFKRILYPSLTAPVFFSDVILADIITSFAKVLGDLNVSAIQIWYGGITQGRVRQYGLANYITLVMVWYVTLGNILRPVATLCPARKMILYSADNEPPLPDPSPPMSC